MRDPYKVGGPVRPGEFYGRGELLETLLERRQQCIYLVGNRMVGKTSVLHRLKAKAQEARYMAIFLDLQATRGEWRLIGAKLRDALAGVPGVAARLSPDLDFVDGVKQLQDADHDTLLLIDEGDILLKQPQAELARLRAALFEPGRLRTIVAATKQLARLSDPSAAWIGSPFLFGFCPHYISPLEHTDALALMRQSNNGGREVRVGDDLGNEIAELTGNHPYLLQRVCSRLFCDDGTLRPLTDADMVLEEMVTVLFETDYLSLSQDERRVLDVVRSAGRATAEAISMELRIEIASLRGYLLNLKSLGYLRTAPSRDTQHQHGYQIASRLIDSWLRSRQGEDAAPVVSDLASLDVASGASRHEFAVFLCYAHADQARVREVAARLKKEAISYWFDDEKIEPGDPITTRIEEGLSRSRFVLACLSSSCLRSGWARAEFGSVVNGQLSGASTTRVIPLLLESLESGQIPPLLRDRSFVKLSDDSALDYLIQFLRRVGGLPPH